jgi:hypothetical protein
MGNAARLERGAHFERDHASPRSPVNAPMFELVFWPAALNIEDKAGIDSRELNVIEDIERCRSVSALQPGQTWHDVRCATDCSEILIPSRNLFLSEDYRRHLGRRNAGVAAAVYPALIRAVLDTTRLGGVAAPRSVRSGISACERRLNSTVRSGSVYAEYEEVIGRPDSGGANSSSPARFTPDTC